MFLMHFGGARSIEKTTKYVDEPHFAAIISAYRADQMLGLSFNAQLARLRLR